MKRRGRARTERPAPEPAMRAIEGELARAHAAREDAERALAQYLSLLECLLDTAPDCYAVKTPEGVYRAASARFCAFAGCTEAALRGRSDRELFDRPVAELLARHDAAVAASSAPYAWEGVIARAEGEMHAEIRKAPILGDRGECIGILLALRDCTAQRRMERQLEVLSRAGAEPAWVLDEHGNLLEANAAYCAAAGCTREELIGRNLHELEPLTPPEDHALRQRRIAETGWGQFKTLHRTKDGRIVEFEVSSAYLPLHGGRFYRFYREVRVTGAAEAAPAAAAPADRARRVISLNESVRLALGLLAEHLPPGIAIEQDLEAKLLNTVANAAQIVQALMNLLTNAAEAIAGRGRIVVSTRNVEIAEELVRAYPHLRPGRYVLASIEDTGRGIGPKLIDKLFEPFITTKFKGRGMGLALAWRNIKEHDGHIAVRSREGQGSTFIVYLPATSAPLDTPGPGLPAPTGTETILLAEPDARARGEARRLLEGLAYRVLEASSGSEAETLLRSHPGRIHLVLLGALPPASQRAAIECVRAARAEAKVALCGPGEFDAAAQALAPCCLAVPLRADLVAPQLRALLDV